MSWKGFFEGIQSIAETLLLDPLDGLRSFELSSWWGANIMSWIFIAIGFVAFFYWMKQLAIFNANGEEDRSQTSHSFLGKS
ncbi:MAG: uracil phosphoribosyltransferase [Alteromonas sp.]|nr:uracil phosphoribosyltransferase [Alteromonas sp.]MAY23823.1 uracil phosphoribosyltransferase [Flavobacteriaceae bacterium]|tara:strand:- start:457 stop:699 length:243 start_codon:yes stop_codon:yes gene_type:complete